ncbi:MAG: type II toxin-antitoxin system VapC family toxin [Chloroflexota bacterium]
MVRFWDTSAIVPLLVDEPMSRAIGEAYERDPVVVVWWATSVECTSAIARRERDGLLASGPAAGALARLSAQVDAWEEIEPSPRVRSTAERVCRTHPLRAADAFQLAAAIVAADGDPGTLPFVTLDERLADAARREGFPIVQPS